MRREAKANNGYYVEPEARLAFVVRIRGINDMHPKTKKILQLLRLRQIHNGIFIRVSFCYVAATVTSFPQEVRALQQAPPAYARGRLQSLLITTVLVIWHVQQCQSVPGCCGQWYYTYTVRSAPGPA